MSNVSAETVRCELGRSLRLTLLWLLIYGGAVVILFLIPLAWAWRGLLSLALLAGLADGLWQIAWRRGARAVTAIRFDHEGDLELRIGTGGDWRNVQWRPGAVLAAIVWLHWRPPGGYWWRRLVIPADAVPTDGFRRLRVALRRRSLPD